MRRLTTPTRNPLRRACTAACALAAVAVLTSGGAASTEERRQAEPGAHSAAGCDRFASPRGRDRWRGSRRRPFRSVPRLTRALRRGQTGCLEAGRYRHREPALLRRPRARLRAVRGARVRVDGPIWITSRATRASLSGIYLTSGSRRFTIPLKVQADRARIRGNVIKGAQSTTCVLVASRRPARGVLIEGNRIQRCGRFGKFDHLIYLTQARDAIVRGNLLLDNRGGWAVHMYPDADGTVVERNVMNGNFGGAVFAGAEGRTSDHNEVRNNAITGIGPRWNIEGSWSDEPSGVGNVARHNCLHHNGPLGPAGIAEPVGFTVRENPVLGESPYLNAAAGDYRFRAGSRCTPLVSGLAVQRAGRRR